MNYFWQQASFQHDNERPQKAQMAKTAWEDLK